MLSILPWNPGSLAVSLPILRKTGRVGERELEGLRKDSRERLEKASRSVEVLVLLSNDQVAMPALRSTEKPNECHPEVSLTKCCTFGPFIGTPRNSKVGKL